MSGPPTGLNVSLVNAFFFVLFCFVLSKPLALSHPLLCVCLCAGNSNNLFSVDRQTGLVTRGRRALDRETSSSHVLEVEAYNSDEGSMRSSVRVRKTKGTDAISYLILFFCQPTTV